MYPDVFSTKSKQVSKSAFDCIPAVNTTLSFPTVVKKNEDCGNEIEV